ncbi:MAG: NYN domain-containing protein [Clostridiales bacterium]|nr:NYN domain-containing protein [Clostridiales bacterium]MBQ4637345.1 NYN domain-containing protein [Clostridia bacterium]
MILVIDGYNVIGAWPDFKNSINLQESREKLIEIMCDYAGYTHDRVILVFDAYLGQNALRTQENISGIEVVYTKNGETADNYIERLINDLCKNLTKQIEVRVATSDLLEQTIVMGRGAARISSLELRSLVMGARQTGKQSHPKEPKTSLDMRLSPEILEKLEKMRRG